MKVLAYSDLSSHSRNRSIGMSYFNRFLIDEEIQNESAGVYELEFLYNLSSTTTNRLKRQLVRIPHAESQHTFVHIIVAAPWTPSLFYSIDNVNLTFTEVFDPKLKIIITKLRCDRVEW